MVETRSMWMAKDEWLRRASSHRDYYGGGKEPCPCPDVCVIRFAFGHDLAKPRSLAVTR